MCIQCIEIRERERDREREREQKCTARALHALGLFTWVYHQLNSKARVF
jgi:hypothetical protein